MRLKKLTLTAALTAAALVMFVLESQLPPLTAIPGIKPGMAVNGGSWLSSTNITSAAAVRTAVSVSFRSFMTALPFR